jgi:NAD(P)-dependent dehydrogenase (short-subunit alcohol dehydrogenase family)
MPPVRLRDQVAIVTGAGRGIGRATALALAEEGCAVALLARTAEQIEAVAAEIRQRRDAGADGRSERPALAVPCDVADEEQVSGAVARVFEEFGRIDLLVNNAGYASRAEADELSFDEWQRTLAVNATGAFLCTRAVLPTMKQQGGGKIVNVISGAGHRGFPLLSAYCAAKHGIVGFAQAVQLEVREQGITVSCVSPGPTATRMDQAGSSPYDRAAMLEPEDVADAILFVATRPPRVIIPEIQVRPRAYL